MQESLFTALDLQHYKNRASDTGAFLQILQTPF